jgi:hypothetical protein
MATLALNVEILGEFKKLTNATKGAENSLKGLQDKVGGFATNITRIVGALGITLGFSALINGAKDAVNAASNLEQQFGALDAIFKENSGEMKVFSKEMNQIGLSSAEAAKQSAYLGSMLKGNGLSLDDTTDKTKDLVLLAGDLAATYGGPTADAVSAIASLMRGERDPIERYGVSLKQVDINAQMLKDAKNGLVFASEKEAAMQATLTLLYEKTTDAQGQAAREADTYAGVTGRLNAMFEDMSAEIGQALLPLLTEFSTWLASPEGEAKLQEIIDGIVGIIESGVELVKWVDDNQDWLVPMLAGIAAVTAAWKLAIAAVGLYRGAVLLAGGAGAAGGAAAAAGGAAAGGAAAGGAAIGGGAVAGIVGGVALGAGLGGYMQGQALAETSRIYAGENSGLQPDGSFKLFGDAFEGWPGTQPTNNVTINVNNGNVTATEIASKINKAIKTTGTNVIGLRY